MPTGFCGVVVKENSQAARGARQVNRFGAVVENFEPEVPLDLGLR